MDYLSSEANLSVSPLLCRFITITIIIIVTGSVTVVDPSSDYSNLVFKGCADQKFPDPAGVYTQNLKSLMSSLVSRSSQKSFYNATAGEGQTAITGIYQCRGDLAAEQCADCVEKTPEIASKLCGETIAARVQLSGCCLRYEVDGFKQVPDTEMLYKVCGKKASGGDGFEERRDTALGTVATGISNGGGGFYTGSYENMYVLGQCEGDLGSGECTECVKSAVEKVKSVCGESISAQIYLQKCYISYSYYPDGAPGDSSSSSPTPGTGSGHGNTQKTVAVVVGGVAALGFGIVCLLFARSAFKKRDVKYDNY